MSDSDIQLVRERRAEIAKLRESLDQEDTDLAITEKTLVRLQAARSSVKPNGNGASLFKPKGAISQGDMILGALRGSAKLWLDGSGELHDLIRSIHGVEINKNSFYPLISDLAKRGLVAKDGPRLALASRVAATREAAE